MMTARKQTKNGDLAPLAAGRDRLFTLNTKDMKAKELREKLETMPEELEVVLCDLQDDGDGDGVIGLISIHSVEVLHQNKKLGPDEDCVVIYFGN